jgi:succinyl-CoA synthetase beta subunit
MCSVNFNIFGGMARVDTIASGIIEAHKEMDINFPVVVRLAGTNAAEGEYVVGATTQSSR